MQVLIEIPPYKEEGARLKAEFESGIAAVLSGPELDRFLATCGPGLAADNSYYGTYAQKILVDATPDGYRLAHSYYGRSGSSMAFAGGLIGYE